MAKILVTGASGFVGAATAQRLVEDGHDVAVLLRSTSDPRRIGNVLDRLTVIRGDMMEIAASQAAVGAFGPDTVVHLAWNSVKGVDRNSPRQIENVSNTIALYELVTQLGCRRFIGLGSQAEYGPAGRQLDEAAPTRPTTLYGAAKLSTYLMLDRLAASQNVSFAWVRLFSSYGPGEAPNSLIPYMILHLLSGQRPSLTKGEQMWDYIHVEDAAAAIASLVENPASGPFNLGHGDAQSLRSIFTKVRDLIDPALKLGFGEIEYQPDQVMYLEADISALSAATGWHPIIPLDQGLQETVEYYRANQK